MNQIYTLGYTGRKLPEIEAALGQLQAVLVDIRFNPYSRNPIYTKGELMCAFGDRYIHVQELGNSAYRTHGMEIASYAVGKLKLLQILEKSSVVMMCACQHPAGCHRTVVADLLRSERYPVTEYMWPKRTDQADQLSLW